MKEVLEYLFGRLKAERRTVEFVEGQPYALRPDGTLGAPVRELAPQWSSPTLEVSTLTGLSDLVRERLDDYDARCALHVVDHLTVHLVSLLADSYGHRHIYARARHTPDAPFRFGEWYAPEDFLIAFRASFLFTEDAVKVQKVCSTVGAGDAVLVADDGLSQEITVKSGTVTRGSVALPADGIPLVPWRTFPEAVPVESRFLLRMKARKDALPAVALFEIDARWKMQTMQSVAKWLREEGRCGALPVIA